VAWDGLYSFTLLGRTSWYQKVLLELPAIETGTGASVLTGLARRGVIAAEDIVECSSLKDFVINLEQRLNSCFVDV